MAPGPAWHPITRQLHVFEADPLRFLQTVYRAHGDVVRLHLWPHLFHLIVGPDAIHHVLGRNHRNYHPVNGSSPGLPVHSPVLARRLNSTLDRQDAFVPLMVEIVETMLSRWQRHAAGATPIDLAEEMRSLTLAVAIRTFFGTATPADDLREIALALKVAATRTGPHLSVSEYQRRAPPDERRDVQLAEAASTLDGFVFAMIERRRGEGPGAGDLLDALVFAHEEPSATLLRDEQLRDTVMVYLVAGHSTTASLLAWTLLLLAQNENAQRCLRTEVDDVCGHRYPTAADLARLPQAELVLREAIRLFPPVWMLAPRVALAEDEIGGYRIPARSRILISPYLTHRHPDLWERPEAFDPQRFTRTPRPVGYVPFGAGPWGCVGRHFGVHEALLVLASIVGRFRWQLIPGSRFEPDPQAALWPLHGIQAVLRARDGPQKPSMRASSPG